MTTESTQLLSRDREDQLNRTREARELQERQQRWQMLADEYHQQLRLARDEVGPKTMATDLGRDISTLSNWFSCEQGRGFPPPVALLYLRHKVPALAVWERQHAELLIEDGEAFTEIERDILPDMDKRSAEKVRSILRRRRSSR